MLSYFDDDITYMSYIYIEEDNIMNLSSCYNSAYHPKLRVYINCCILA